MESWCSWPRTCWRFAIPSRTRIAPESFTRGARCLQYAFGEWFISLRLSHAPVIRGRLPRNHSARKNARCRPRANVQGWNANSPKTAANLDKPYSACSACSQRTLLLRAFTADDEELPQNAGPGHFTETPCARDARRCHATRFTVHRHTPLRALKSVKSEPHLTFALYSPTMCPWQLPGGSGRSTITFRAS
jgi:hypothetical protein